MEGGGSTRPHQNSTSRCRWRCRRSASPGLVRKREAPASYMLSRCASLVSEESSQVQYRFKDIVDPDSGKYLFTIEHEVRCVTHPMFMRPLISRNPGQRQPTYQRGRDAYVPGLV